VGLEGPKVWLVPRQRLHFFFCHLPSSGESILLCETIQSPMMSSNSAPSRRKRAHAELDPGERSSAAGASTRSLLSSPLQHLSQNSTTNQDKANTTTNPDAFSDVARNLMSSPLFPRNTEVDDEGNHSSDSTIVVRPPAPARDDQQEFPPPNEEHDFLLRQVSSWIEDLTRTREGLQRASVSNKSIRLFLCQSRLSSTTHKLCCSRSLVLSNRDWSC
jgi:hypothetical protein